MLELNFQNKRTKRRLLLIQKIALFLSKTQGRDKLCKLLQYFFRFIAACYQIDSYKNIKYHSLNQSTKDTRKIFRLFKSINQYEGMAYILFNQDQNFTNFLKLISRACYFFYWAFDNVSILAKIKLFRLNYERPYRIGYSFWFFALVFMNIGLLIQLFFDRETKNKIQQDLTIQRLKIPEKCTLIHDFYIQNEQKLVEVSQQEKKKKRKQKWFQLIKNSFDLIPSGKQSQILEIVFNRVIPEKLVGICGFASASISIYQIAKEINQTN